MANSSYNREVLQEMWENQKDDSGRLGVLFLVSMNTSDRVEKLEKRKRVDSIYSFAGGVFGGASAILAKLAIWK